MTDTLTPAVSPAASGLRRWGGLLAALTLVCGAVGMAVADRQDAERADLGRVAPPSALPGPVQPADVDDAARGEAIDAILARRSTAVMTVDERMFLADVDPSKTALLAGQRRLFANLVDLGLTSLHYEQRQAQFDQAVINRHGPTAYLVRVWMTYEIKGIDAEPVKTELGYTYALHDGHWMLVDDDDLDVGLVAGGHREPWDLSRLEIHRSQRLMVLVDKGQTSFARTVVREATEALATVDKYWPQSWHGSVLISATNQARVRGADFTGTDTESSASATGTFRSLPGEENSDGVFSGAYVVINPAEHKNVDEIMLSHEFTHVAVARLGGYEPLWLAEGVAEYVSWKGVEEISGTDDVAEWETDVQRNALPRLKALPADDGFYDSQEDVYGISWLAVRCLVRKIGVDKVVALYEDIAADGFTDFARAEAMQTNAGLTEPQLFAALKTYQPEG